MKKGYKIGGAPNKAHLNPASLVHREHAEAQWFNKTTYLASYSISKRIATALRLAGVEFPSHSKEKNYECEGLPPAAFLLIPPEKNEPSMAIGNQGIWSFGYSEVNANFDPWVDKITDIHSGYMTERRGRKGDHLPKFYEREPCDDSLLYKTISFCPWDSDSLRESVKMGYIQQKDFENFLEKIRLALFDDQFIGIVSGGATKRLLLAGIIFHVLGGVLHIHPVFIKSSPLLFLNNKREYLVKSKAPGGGRRGAGERWVGGERFGTLGKTNKLIIAGVGPAILGAVALRAIGLPPPIELGRDWGRLDFILKSRAQLDTKNCNLTSNEVEEIAAFKCFDLYAQKILAREVAAFCELHPRFAEVRSRRIAEHTEYRKKMDRSIIDYLLGEEYRKLEEENGELLTRKHQQLQDEEALKLSTSDLQAKQAAMAVRESMLVIAERKMSVKMSEIEKDQEKIEATRIEIEAERNRLSKLIRDNDQRKKEIDKAQIDIAADKKRAAVAADNYLKQKKNEYQILLRLKTLETFDVTLFMNARDAIVRSRNGQFTSEDLLFYTEDFKRYALRVLSQMPPDKIKNTALVRVVADFIKFDQTHEKDGPAMA